MMTIATKTKEITEASASVGLLLATALLVWGVYMLQTPLNDLRGKGEALVTAAK